MEYLIAVQERKINGVRAVQKTARALSWSRTAVLPYTCHATTTVLPTFQSQQCTWAGDFATHAENCARSVELVRF